MKQLVNKYDRRIRLAGLDDVLIEGRTGEALGERPRLYYRFAMPMGSGDVECLWSGQDWALEEVTRQGESKAFRDWLRKAVKEKGYCAAGVSLALGFSRSWLTMILKGKMYLRPKHWAALERALQMEEGAIAEALRTKTSEKPTIREDV